jgi:hypothetical protein
MKDAHRYMDGIFRFYTFFDKISYKILFIPSYGLKDMNLARITCLQEFSEKRKRKKLGLLNMART